jgi:hypothetical protein
MTLRPDQLLDPVFHPHFLLLLLKCQAFKPTEVFFSLCLPPTYRFPNVFGLSHLRAYGRASNPCPSTKRYSCIYAIRGILATPHHNLFLTPYSYLPCISTAIYTVPTGLTGVQLPLLPWQRFMYNVLQRRLYCTW